MVTDSIEVLVSPVRDTTSLAPCLHEEADTRMFVHAADAASRGHKKMIVRTVDLFVLRFYGPVNPIGSCRARSVYLTTHLLGRLSPLGG